LIDGETHLCWLNDDDLDLKMWLWSHGL